MGGACPSRNSSPRGLEPLRVPRDTSGPCGLVQAGPRDVGGCGCGYVWGPGGEAGASIAFSPFSMISYVFLNLCH